MLTRKRRLIPPPRASRRWDEPKPDLIDRREFLRRSGLGGSGLAALTGLAGSLLTRTDAVRAAGDRSETRKTVCTQCSVGCTVVAKVDYGVWLRQQPGADSPINSGSYCARGAALRQHVVSERRLKYPMVLRDGRWTRLTWDEAVREISDKLSRVRSQHGPDAVYFAGSSHLSNEQAYLLRKFAACWGTNNIDAQGRQCHGIVTLTRWLRLGRCGSVARWNTSAIVAIASRAPSSSMPSGSISGFH